MRATRATMKPIMRTAFAVFLAVAMMGVNARAEEHEEFTEFGNCAAQIHDDVFDGKIAWAYCAANTTHVPVYAPIYSHVYARCLGNTTELYIYLPGEAVLDDGIRLRTALDGIETPEWDWEINPIDNKALFIRSAIPTIKKLLEHYRLQIRIIESNGEQHNSDIDISRLGEAIAPVRELCGW